jgi:uncharacterized membrane protein (UPF0127 family)
MNLSKFTIGFIVVFFLTVIGLQFWKYNWPTATIKLDDEVMNVLVADTNYRQKKGLGGRESLGKYDGMLFIIYPPHRAPIVMRDMKFAIDIIWLKNGKVVDIKKNIKPEPNKTEEELTKYKPEKDANAILEVSSGWVNEHNIKIGDKLEILKEI